MVILASASPRRRQLMQEGITSRFNVITPEIDESLSFKKYKDVKAIVKDIALRKCLKVASEHDEDLVIAADTVVVINKQIIGKPHDEKDAYRILKTLSNHKHYVYTGYAIKRADKLIRGVSKTTVYFNDLDDDLINAYIASGSPMDKAGAYGYQDNNDFRLVKKVDGSLTNVIGFPLEDIKKVLVRDFDFDLTV